MKKIIAILLVIISIYVWNTDLFQRNVFPKNYWGEEISKLERIVKFSKLNIDNQTLKNIQFINNYSSEYMISYNAMITKGVSEKKAEELASKHMETELEINNKTLEFLERSIKRTEEKLEIANLNYSKNE
jgi:hypothetical protein